MYNKNAKKGQLTPRVYYTSFDISESTWTEIFQYVGSC